MPNRDARVVLNDEVLSWADLVGPDDRVADLIATDCLVVGPAVISLGADAEFPACTFHGAVEGLVWGAPKGWSPIGAITVENSTFIGCTFARTGIVVPDGDLAAVRQQLREIKQ